jgi:hypothetical protein
LIRQSLATAIAVVCIAAWAGPIHAITCEECQANEAKKASIQREIAQKEQELRTALDQKNLRGMESIRKQSTDLMRNLLELQKKETGCKDACRPEMVKEARCSRIRSDILRIEESSDADKEVATLDKLYRDLAQCNKDLSQMKKAP